MPRSCRAQTAALASWAPLLPSLLAAACHRRCGLLHGLQLPDPDVALHRHIVRVGGVTRGDEPDRGPRELCLAAARPTLQPVGAEASLLNLGLKSQVEASLLSSMHPSLRTCTNKDLLLTWTMAMGLPASQSCRIAADPLLRPDAVPI